MTFDEFPDAVRIFAPLAKVALGTLPWTVRLDDLVTNQRLVRSDRILALAEFDGPMEAIHLVRYRGRFFIIDGNHRAYAAALKGMVSILAWVVDL